MEPCNFLLPTNPPWGGVPKINQFSFFLKNIFSHYPLGGPATEECKGKLTTKGKKSIFCCVLWSVPLVHSQGGGHCSEGQNLPIHSLFENPPTHDPSSKGCQSYSYPPKPHTKFGRHFLQPWPPAARTKFVSCPNQPIHSLTPPGVIQVSNESMVRFKKRGLKKASHPPKGERRAERKPKGVIPQDHIYEALEQS